MPRQSIFIATDNQKAVEFITAYFAETGSIPSIIRSKSDLSVLFDCRPNVIFLQDIWIDRRLMRRLAKFKSEFSKMKCFCLGTVPPNEFAWDGGLHYPLDEKVFRKAILSKMEFPSPIKLVIVDDEADISDMIRDYFEVRTDPPFGVRTALNGLEGFKLIEEDRPHCLILDLKMPVRTGVELYRDLIRSGYRIPTIVFIDSTAADDILEIRRWGAPVFVEKGGPSSSMSDMLALVKKLVAFS